MHKGDDKKIEELLTMTTNTVEKTKIDELDGYEVKQFSNEELESKVSILEEENSQKDAKIIQQKNEIKKLKKILATHNIII